MDFHDCELETQLKGALQVVCGIKFTQVPLSGLVPLSWTYDWGGVYTACGQRG